MSNEKTASTPQGYGHDAKGAAGGKNVPDGRVTVTHSEPVGTIGGRGPDLRSSSSSSTESRLRLASAKRSGRSRNAWAAKSRICVIRPRRTIGLTAIAAPAWWRSRASACWRASCKRTPAVGMKVKSASDRAVAAQKMVMELLVADQPARETSHDPDLKFWHWAEKVGVTESRFPAAERWDGDASHPAMRVNLDACIQCGLCVRACREVQVNDVIGMAYRNHAAKIVFDFDDPMGESTCVACGECVQACPDRGVDAGGHA